MIILVLAAIVPAIALLSYVYKVDKLDKESPQLLKQLVFWGALSTLLATITESVGEFILGRIYPVDSKAYNIILYFIIVALSEEGFKYIILKKRTWNHPEYNCMFDGVVYAVFVSMGFAIWENIKYVFAYGLGTALIRAVTAIPGHACFGVFMGTWYALAKWLEGHGRPGASGFLRVFAVLIPTALHGCYDYLATREAQGSIGFIIFIVILFIISFLLVKIMSEKDRYIVDVGYVDKDGNFKEIQ